MSITITGLLLLSLTPFLLGCGNHAGNASKSRKSTVTIAGSTSVMPFSEKLAEHFKVEQPRITVDVQGGGSSAGIQACINRTVDIGMSSRDLIGDEKTLKQIIICHDGIAIVVHPQKSYNGYHPGTDTGHLRR